MVPSGGPPATRVWGNSVLQPDKTVGKVYSELKNLCVWNKTNAGMGSFYRSKHELVFVWKSRTAAHTNNFELGQHGRNRTNVWDYAGISSMRAGRLEELAMHPTVKPVALVADAIKDCSRRSGLVLDPFCGSGRVPAAANPESGAVSLWAGPSR
jgi:DNA modification methylase